MRAKWKAGFALPCALACAVLLLPAAASAAETQATSLKKIPVTGKAANGKSFKGTYTVTRFAPKGGELVAIGRLVGKVGGRSVSKGGVAMPVTVNGSNGLARASATCGILDLTLGPLDLKLLGLRVQLNQVHLQITAESGPGNLLGNLLCSVVGLLDKGGLNLGQISGLVNIVLQLVNNPSLAGLPATTII